MRRIPIINSRRVALVDNRDYRAISSRKWYLMSGRRYAASPSTVNGRTVVIYMHRLIAETPSGFVTDHRNRNRLDNRRRNLRTATNSQNIVNQSKQGMRRGIRKYSRYRGVTWHRTHLRWVAKTSVNGRAHFIGYFRTQISAYRAFCRFMRRTHQDFFTT